MEGTHTGEPEGFQPGDLAESPVCLTCGGECCKTFSITVSPGSYMLDLIRIHYGQPDVERVQFTVKHTCVYLTPEGLCGVWDDPKRPEFCRRWLCKKAQQPKTLALNLSAEE